MELREKLLTRIQNLKLELGSTQLVAVTKYSDNHEVYTAYDCGLKNFGENRVEELLKKSNFFCQKGISDVNWHFIGKLQSNKINKLLSVPGLAYIHSIDSYSLIQKLANKKDIFQGSSLRLFFQINTSNEKEKLGFSNIEEVLDSYQYAEKNLFSKKIIFEGLMTMGRIRSKDINQDALKSFTKLVDMRDQLEKRLKIKNLKLSMGMSGDYKIAKNLGADFVRIGGHLFKDLN